MITPAMSEPLRKQRTQAHAEDEGSHARGQFCELESIHSAPSMS